LNENHKAKKASAIFKTPGSFQLFQKLVLIMKNKLMKNSISKTIGLMAFPCL
jgi:hypothetical protein